MTDRLVSCVEFWAYDRDGGLVLHEVIPDDAWYDKLHPIIDEDGERLRLGVVTVEGRQLDAKGGLVKEWKNTYGETGAIEEMWQRQRDGEVTILSRPFPWET